MLHEVYTDARLRRLGEFTHTNLDLSQGGERREFVFSEEELLTDPRFDQWMKPCRETSFIDDTAKRVGLFR